MPRPREAANNSLARNVVRIRTATPPDGVFSHATAALSLTLSRLPPPLPSPVSGGGSGWGRVREGVGALSTAEIFLIRNVVLDQHATIDGQRHAGDHARRVTRQEQDGIGDILGFAHAAKRDFARPHSLRFLRRHGAAKPRRGRTRADGVDADPVWGELVGRMAGQAEEPRL